MSEQSQIPEISDLDLVCGTTDDLPAWESLTDAEKHMRGPFCDVASKLFFNGGKIADHGLIPKPGVDVAKATRCIFAHLRSWEPPHEHKIGGVGNLLAQWFTEATRS